jgi:hypothetical protein
MDAICACCVVPVSAMYPILLLQPLARSFLFLACAAFYALPLVFCWFLSLYVVLGISKDLLFRLSSRRYLLHYLHPTFFFSAYTIPPFWAWRVSW